MKDIIPIYKGVITYEAFDCTCNVRCDDAVADSLCRWLGSQFFCTGRLTSAVAEERAAVRVGGLKGPTAMGMVKLMEEDAAGTTANDYEFTLAWFRR